MTTLDLTTMHIGARLVTRGGNRARLLANDVKGDFPCLIAVEARGGEQIHNTGPDGLVGDESTPHPHDIVGVARARHRVRVLLSRNANGTYIAIADHETEEAFTVLRWSHAVADQIVEIEESAP